MQYSIIFQLCHSQHMYNTRSEFKHPQDSNIGDILRVQVMHLNIFVPIDYYMELCKIRKSQYVNKNIYLLLSKKYYKREYTQLRLHDYGFHTEFVQGVNSTLFFIQRYRRHKVEEGSSVLVSRKLYSPDEKFVALLCLQSFVLAHSPAWRYPFYCLSRRRLSTKSSFFCQETQAWTRYCYGISSWVTCCETQLS